MFGPARRKGMSGGDLLFTSLRGLDFGLSLSASLASRRIRLESCWYEGGRDLIVPLPGAARNSASHRAPRNDRLRTGTIQGNPTV